MGEQPVVVYCLLDNLLALTHPVRSRPADLRRRLTDVQVLTTSLVRQLPFKKLVRAEAWQLEGGSTRHLRYGGSTQKASAAGLVVYSW